MKLYRFLRKNSFLLIYTVFAVFFTHGSKLFLYSVTVDTELIHVFKDNLGWIGHGRYGMTLLKYLTGSTGNFVPYVSVFLGIVSLILAGVAWSFLFQHATGEIKTAGVGEYLFVGAFISYPSLAEYFNFYQYSFEVSFCIFLIAIGIILLAQASEKQDKKLWLIGTILFILVLSVYQALLPMIVGGLALYHICYYLRNKIEKQKLHNLVLYFSTGFILSNVGYFVSSQFFKHFVPKDDYVDSQFMWGKAPPREIIGRLYNYFSDMLWRDSTYAQICGRILGICILVLITYGVYMLITQRRLNRLKGSGIRLLSLIIFIFSPFMVPIAIGNPLTVRTYFCNPLIVGAALYFIGNILRLKRRKTTWVILFILFLLPLHQAETVNKLYYGDYIRYKHDYDMIQKISYDIDKLGLGEVPKLPVAILGKYETPENNTTMVFDVLGRSIFEWNSPYRNTQFFNISGHPYGYPSDAFILEEIKEIQKMPCYPSEGSVRKFNKIIVVKLSNELPF